MVSARQTNETMLALLLIITFPMVITITLKSFNIDDSFIISKNTNPLQIHSLDLQILAINIIKQCVYLIDVGDGDNIYIYITHIFISNNKTITNTHWIV